MRQRRYSSIWGKIKVKERPEAVVREWVPPPRNVKNVEKNTTRGRHNSEVVPRVVEGKIQPREHRMAARMKDLPWPGVVTNKSVQIVEPDTDLGTDIWLPERDQSGLLAEEQSLIQTEFTFADDIPDCDYKRSYTFSHGFTRVERSINERDKLGDAVMRDALTEFVTFRTREVVPRDGVAYISLPLVFSCLHFGIGAMEAQAFNPRKWIGYEEGTWAHNEDGRIGTKRSYHFGRVLKADDVAGVLLYSPPEEKVARLLFFRNEEPSGEVITLPKSEVGWHFGVTMIGYHYGGAVAKIAPRAGFAPKALEWLGSLLDPTDTDFTNSEAQYKTKLIQNYCANRMNPYHVCNDFCRQPSPERFVSNDPYNKPYPSDDLPVKPSWLKRAHDQSHDAAHKNGSWKFSFNPDNNRHFSTKIYNIMDGPNPKKKGGRTKYGDWNMGAMKFA